MRFRLLATIFAVLSACGSSWAQAAFLPETDNAALRYWFALAQVWEPNDVATRNSVGAALGGQVAWDEAKLGPLLDSNLDALRTMQQATKLPKCDWGFDYRHGTRMPIWFGMQARLLSELNSLQGKREMAHGDSQSAVDRWLAGVHFGQDFSRAGPVVVALIAHAIVLDNLRPLRDTARQGKLNEKQKTELFAIVKAMPDDAFDWGAPWGVEFATGDEYLQELRKARKPESDDKIRAYEVYMLAAQAALRQPPTEAKPQVDNLETSILQLGRTEQLLIPGVRGTNNARLEIATMRDELLQALTSK